MSVTPWIARLQTRYWDLAKSGRRCWPSPLLTMPVHSTWSRKKRETGRYLLLGFASMDLMRQSGEPLAGRIAYVYMGPLNILEAGDEEADSLWVRDGFPDAYLGRDDAASLARRTDLVHTYLERDIPMLGPRIPSQTMERLWTMLAHGQGSLFNASELAASLMISAQTVTRYVDLLVDLLLVRRLVPYRADVG